MTNSSHPFWLFSWIASAAIYKKKRLPGFWILPEESINCCLDTMNNISYVVHRIKTGGTWCASHILHHAVFTFWVTKESYGLTRRVAFFGKIISSALILSAASCNGDVVTLTLKLSTNSTQRRDFDRERITCVSRSPLGMTVLSITPLGPVRYATNYKLSGTPRIG